MRSLFVAAAALSLLVACQDGKQPDSSQPTTTTNAAQTQATPAVSGNAEVGKPAPDFTLKDLNGQDVKLSSFKGKTVVLEWFNPGCPFVNASHLKGSLKDAAQKSTAKGVVWLSINSGAPGKQGNGVAANQDGVKKFSMNNPVLLDESGKVGHMYGATNTPHIMVIDDKGTLVYRGAVDNSPDGEGESPTGGKLVSYIDSALTNLAAGQPVSPSETKAYGCSVKYDGASH